MKKTKNRWLLLVCLFICSQVVWSQEQPVAPAAPRVTRAEAPPSPAVENKNKGVLIETSEDYKIGIGDVLEIQIEDAPELSRLYRVTTAGTFQVPVVGTVNAVGTTAEQLVQGLEKSLKENDYLKNPQVNVTVKQYNSQTFFVHGEVRQPGVYQVEGRPSLLKLLSLAGGLTDKHGTTIFLLQPEKTPAPKNPAPTSLASANVATLNNATTLVSTEKVTDTNEANADYALVRIKISDLLKGDPTHNPRVETGAVVYIPESDTFFVGGEVNAPGSFQLKDGTTLRQAISLAKGMTPKALPTKALIFREDSETGKRIEIKVNINDVMNGKQEDLALRSNDVIVLPSSKMKNITSSFINAMPSAAAVALGQLPFLFLR